MDVEWGWESLNEFIKKLINRLEEITELIRPVGWSRKIEVVETKAVIEIVNKLTEEYNNDVCEWKQDDKEIDVYYTKCGQAHIFIDGSPAENNHEFCPYCGKRIKVVE